MRDILFPRRIRWSLLAKSYREPLPPRISRRYGDRPFLEQASSYVHGRKSTNKRVPFICIVLTVARERRFHFPRCQVNFMPWPALVRVSILMTSRVSLVTWLQFIRIEWIFHRWVSWRVDSPLVVFYRVILNSVDSPAPPHEYSCVIFQENRISMMNRTFTERVNFYGTLKRITGSSSPLLIFPFFIFSFFFFLFFFFFFRQLCRFNGTICLSLSFRLFLFRASSSWFCRLTETLLTNN